MVLLLWKFTSLLDFTLLPSRPEQYRQLDANYGPLSHARRRWKCKKTGKTKKCLGTRVMTADTRVSGSDERRRSRQANPKRNALNNLFINGDSHLATAKRRHVRPDRQGKGDSHKVWRTKVDWLPLRPAEMGPMSAADVSWVDWGYRIFSKIYIYRLMVGQTGDD